MKQVSNKIKLLSIIATLTLTACGGGGGGGGGGTGSDTTQPPVVIDVEQGMAGFVADGKVVTNVTDITTENGIGIVARARGTANNAASVTSAGQGAWGMFTEDGTIINLAKGTLIISGGTGMNVSGSLNYATNYGLITGTEDADTDTMSIGMESISGAKVTNEATGKIEIQNGIGMVATGKTFVPGDKYLQNSGAGSVANNKGLITITATRSNMPITITNIDKYGVVTSKDFNGIGMQALKGGVAENTGTIKLIGNALIGIHADGTGSIASNRGTIDMTEATNSYGIYLTNGATMSNRGTIILGGGSSGNVAGNNNGTPLQANTKIYISPTSSLYNSGLMDYRGATFNTNTLGGGKFYISKDGTLLAERIIGDIYVAPNKIMGTYDTTAKVNDAFVANNLSVKVYLKSIFYNMAVEENGQASHYGLYKGYDVALTMKQFKEVVLNSHYAKLLQNNFDAGDTGSEAKNELYKYIENSATTKEANDRIYNLLGNGVYPSIAKQNYENIEFLNKDLFISTVNDSDKNLVVGYKYFNTSSETSGYQESYKTNLNAFTIGYSKELDSENRLGFASVFADGESKFDKDSDIKNKVYQLNLFMKSSYNGVINIFTPYMGTTDGTLNRKLTLGDETKTDVDSKYYGIYNQTSKTFDVKTFYVTPKFDVNMSSVTQKEIKEASEYGVTLYENYSSSFVTGLELIVGKKFAIKNDYKLDTSVFGKYNHEFGNPNKALDGSANSLYGNVELEKYNFNRDSGDVGGRVELEFRDVRVFGEYKHVIGQESNDERVSTGIVYKF